MSSKLRTAAARIALLSLGLTVAATICEILVRVVPFGPKLIHPVPYEDTQLSENRVLRFEGRPNASFDWSVDHRPHPIEIRHNAFGFRDRNWQLAKPEGVTRILVLGDSTTAGNDVRRNEDIYPRILEGILNDRHSHRRFEVFNMGVSGYDTMQEAEMLRYRGLQFQPDYVLIAFCLNDFNSGQDGGAYRRLLRANELGPRSEFAFSRRNIVLEHSRLALLLHEVVGSLSAPPEQQLVPWDDANVTAGLKLVRALQEEHGFQSLLFVIPTFYSPFANYRDLAIHEKLVIFNANSGRLTLVDLLEDFRAAGVDGLSGESDGVHPQEVGNRMIAEFLATHLSRVFPELRE